VFFVPETTFRDRISRDLDDEIYTAQWTLIMDGSDVRASDAGPLSAHIRSVWQRAEALLPSTRLPLSPLENLGIYQRTAAVLTVLLYAFSVPILGLVLAFVTLTASLTVERQRGALAVLRSRGATVLQLAGIALLESLLLGLIGLALGWPIGLGVAQLIGRARSFLDFSAALDLRVVMTPLALRFALVIVALAMGVYIVPTLSAARHTVITFKQERARLLRAAWWQRVGLDLLLLALAGYGLYVLRRQGGLTLALPGGPTGGDPFQNPLLFLVPALAGAALTLAVLRAMPVVARAAAWLLGRTGSVGLLLATRHLARTPGAYNAPLALLMLTLSLSIYTASLAQTLDDHLVAQIYYSVGADMRVDETGEMAGDPNSPFEAAGGAASGARWLLLPISEHLTIPGVQAAARVGEYMAATQLSGSLQSGTFVGIDRLDFPQVAFWRRDFAPESLGALMNRLALQWDGVLVPSFLLADYGLAVGDPLRISVNLPRQLIHLDTTIAGAFDLFPGWNPADGLAFVGNLDYVFENAGSEYPSSVWLRADPQTDPAAIADGVGALGLKVLDWQAAAPQIQQEQSRPERQGLFGLLSVGAVASALLTVVGFGLYALFSFHRRFIELGVLRAMGLSSRQMGAFLAWELAILILTGLGAGTAIGVWLTREFIPHLQIQTGPTASLPPFVVVIAWPSILQMYVLFGLLFLGGLASLVVHLRRMRIFEAVKLGEAT
jgi:putative ABC transport system permease protein